MSNEEFLLNFYNDFIDLLQKDKLSSTICFEELVTIMLFGYEFEEKSLNNSSVYELLLVWNLTFNNYTNKSKNDYDTLRPFSDIDFIYYYNILKNISSDFLLFSRINMMCKLTTDLEHDNINVATTLIIKMNPNFINAFKVLASLKEIMRKGWIKRSVDINYQENDQTHTIQMLAFTSAYFRIYKPTNLDLKRILEMIIIHEVGEKLAGDICDDGNIKHLTKHDIERKCVLETFTPLKSGQYFISLWEEFESRETDEASFAYCVDKLDPVLKAKYIEQMTNHQGLFNDFYDYEENRSTFTNTPFEKIFKELKKQYNKEYVKKGES